MDRDFIHSTAMDLIDSIEVSICERDNRGREKEIIGLPEVHIIEKFLLEAYKRGTYDVNNKQ